MSVLLATRPDRTERWRRALQSALAGEGVDVWPDLTDPQHVEVVVTGEPLPLDIDTLPALRFIAATGAGVDRLLASGVPDRVPVVRLVDERLTSSMAEYLLAAVLGYHRQFDQYEAAQRARRWEALPRPEAAETRVSILGLGVLGQATAALLTPLGFRIAGWSRTARTIPGVETFHGRDGLMQMLARTDTCR